jgi:hypothetical protein
MRGLLLLVMTVAVLMCRQMPVVVGVVWVLKVVGVCLN